MKKYLIIILSLCIIYLATSMSEGDQPSNDIPCNFIFESVESNTDYLDELEIYLYKNSKEILEDLQIETPEIITITFYSSKAEYQNSLNRIFEDYEIGHAKSRTEIEMVSPLASDINISKEDMFKVVVHEVTHCYMNQKYEKSINQVWL